MHSEISSGFRLPRPCRLSGRARHITPPRELGRNRDKVDVAFDASRRGICEYTA